MQEKIQLAWLAGLIDGEGSFGKTSPSIRIVLQERDKFVLEKVIKIAKCGNLNFRPLNTKNPKWQNQWVWNLYKHKDIVVLIKKLLPYLVLKKSDAEKMLVKIEEKIENKYGV